MALADCIGKPQMISYRNESFPPLFLPCLQLIRASHRVISTSLLRALIHSEHLTRSLRPLWSSAYCLDRCFFPSAASRRRDQPWLARRPSQNNSQITKHGRGEWDYWSRGCAWNGPTADSEGDRFPFRTWLKAVWWRQSTFAINSWERRTPGHVTVLKLSGLYWKEAIFPSV